MQYAYPCRLIPDREEEGAGFVVTFSDVPAAITGARTRKESLVLAEDAFVAAKLALYTDMRAQHLTDAVLADRLGLNESTVQKLVDPGHRSHISHVMKALRAVGRNLVTEDRAA